jgi:hypothetical protein
MKKHETDKLDRMLSGRLKKALDNDGHADWLDVSKRAGIGRTSWRWSKRRVLLVAGILVLAAGTSVAATGIVPWRGDEPKLPPPTVYPVCKANDVAAKLRLQEAPKLRHGLSGELILVNTGEPACALEGQMKVSLVGSGASNTKLRVELFPELESVFSPDPKKNPRSSGQTLLGRVYKPWDQASGVHIWWENWCSSDSGMPSLKFELDNGSTLILAASKVPSCVDPSKPSLLRIDGARGAWVPPAESPQLRAEIVVDEVGEPIQVTAGEVLHYQVGLTNTGASPYRFGDRCPIYSEAASSGNGDLLTHFPFASRAFELNCRSVEAIEPGETVTFDMELTVPKDAWQRGQGTLTWILEPGTKNPPTARATIAVTGETSDYSPADVYSAFAPGTQEATFPAKAEKNIGFASSQWGPVVPDSKRILMKESGTAIYAWETESGRVCYFVGYGGSCDRGEAQTNPIAWIGLDGAGKEPSSVGGLVRDGVKTVDVIVDGESVAARFGNNAFYAEVAPGRKITAIVATMDDGSQKTVAIGPLG